MNEVNARAVEMSGGFQGQMRKVHRAEWEPVCHNGQPVLFASAELAEIAAWRALKAHLCADIVGSGEKASFARIEANKIFPGKGRVVEVVRR